MFSWLFLMYCETSHKRIILFVQLTKTIFPILTYNYLYYRPLNWWLGYYLWFSSMYYQCLALFPAMYNYFFTKTRKNLRCLIKWMVWLQVRRGICISESSGNYLSNFIYPLFMITTARQHCHLGSSLVQHEERTFLQPLRC